MRREIKIFPNFKEMLYARRIPILQVSIDFTILPPSRGRVGRRFIAQMHRLTQKKQSLMGKGMTRERATKKRLVKGPIKAIKNSFSELLMYPSFKIPETPKGRISILEISTPKKRAQTIWAPSWIKTDKKDRKNIVEQSNKKAKITVGKNKRSMEMLKILRVGSFFISDKQSQGEIFYGFHGHFISHRIFYKTANVF